MHTNNGIWVSTEDLTREETFLQKSEQEFSIENMADEKSVGGWEANRRDFLKVLGFGLGAATLAASCEIPVKKAIPYVTKPDEIVPGVANYFASSFVNGGDYCPILVKTREGRPIKIEGNSLSPMTGGGTNARAQALVLSLYDTKRIKSAGKIENGEVKEMSWADLDRAVKSALAAGNVRVITGTIMSPSAQAALNEFKIKYPTAQVVSYDPVSAAALLEANRQCYGIAALPSYRFDKAMSIVSFGADFLGTWISPIEYARDYAKNRKLHDLRNARMSRHYQVESNMSLTGSNADNRILVKPSEQGAAIVAL
ncbi:MAG: TAT-variant-translocated molybdopterin oxidoreductase, partial [Saprospiraceae bacterium]